MAKQKIRDKFMSLITKAAKLAIIEKINVPETIKNTANCIFPRAVRYPTIAPYKAHHKTVKDNGGFGGIYLYSDINHLPQLHIIYANHTVINPEKKKYNHK